MTDYWEPWESVAYCLPTFRADDGRTFAVPFYAFGETEDNVKTTVLVHLGAILNRQGIDTDWLRPAAQES